MLHLEQCECRKQLELLFFVLERSLWYLYVSVGRINAIEMRSNRLAMIDSLHNFEILTKQYKSASSDTVDGRNPFENGVPTEM